MFSNNKDDALVVREYEYLKQYIIEHPELSFKGFKKFCKENPCPDAMRAFRRYRSSFRAMCKRKKVD